MHQTGSLTILVAPEVNTFDLVAVARDAAHDIGARLVGIPDRVDHGIVRHDGRDVDLRKAGMHMVTFHLERDIAV